MFVLHGSIGGYFALLAIFVVFKNSRKAVSLGLTIFAVCALLMMMTDYFHTSESVESFTGLFVDKFTTERRANDYYVAAEIFFQHPLGVGESKLVQMMGIFPHNNFLGLAGAFGVFGLVLAVTFSSILVLVFLRSNVGRQQPKIVWSIIMMGVFIMLKGLVHDTWYDPIIWVATGSAFAYLTEPLSGNSNFKPK